MTKFQFGFLIALGVASCFFGGILIGLIFVGLPNPLFYIAAGYCAGITWGFGLASLQSGLNDTN